MEQNMLATEHQLVLETILTATHHELSDLLALSQIDIDDPFMARVAIPLIIFRQQEIEECEERLRLMIVDAQMMSDSSPGKVVNAAAKKIIAAIKRKSK